MARSQVDLANAALGYLVRDTIRDLDSTSPGAVQTKQNMAQAVEEVIEEYDWPSCRVVAPLVIAASVSLRGWTYAYAVPSDCAQIWRVSDERGNVYNEWEQGMSADVSSDKSYIYTNLAGAFIRYGSTRVGINRFPAKVFNLIAIKLAEKCCMTLIKDAKLHKYLGELYKMELSKVKTITANAEPEAIDTEFVPELISVYNS